MQLPDVRKITIDKVNDPFLKTKNIELDVLRLDKIHPVISGNKWFKLKCHLDNFNAGNYKGILTFGGAWSNHIVATACTCHLLKIDCVGIIRGEKSPQLPAALRDAMQYGMHLQFTSRAEYKQKDKEEFINSLIGQFPGYYIVPEGGAGETGEKGAAGILRFVPRHSYSHIVCAVGTATMFNGIRKAVLAEEVIGIVVLKGWPDKLPGQLLYDYHFGGYAKFDRDLIAFMNEFFRRSNIPTDFVYTAKTAFAIYDLLKKNLFRPSARILMIHSGGLQGNRSLQKGSLIF